jgi:hypothetical protein
VAIIVSVVGILLVLNERSEREKQLHEMRHMIGEVVSSCLTETLLTEGDYPYLETYVTHIVKRSQGIVSVRVWRTDSKGRMLVAEYPPGSQSQSESESHPVVRSSVEIQAEGLPPEKLGEVELAFSTQ